MKRLLIEIKTEEIPAGYILPALEALGSKLSQKLTDARIAHGTLNTMGTPRRLVVEITDVAEKQRSLTTEILGPPERVGYDAEGAPTLAGQKFAEKAGVSVDGIRIKETEKGRYLMARKKERGVATGTLLKAILPEAVLATPFPKTMKWGALDIYFARPIHSVLALLGDRVVSFSIGNLKSGRYTTGHRFLHPKRIKIKSAEEYADRMRAAYVDIDPQQRRLNILEQIDSAAQAQGGRILSDPELVDTVTNLVEYPVAVAGHFDEVFLKLPAPILITAMREHQKYFAVVDASDRLLPCFIAVNNMAARDMSLVAKGHERVLRARLSDARFFYSSDLDVSSDERVAKLKGVLFQAKLGTMFEKVERVEALCEYLAAGLLADDRHSGLDPELTQRVRRAAYLCKSDLVSQVVVEFPKLQGVMGGIYAAEAGEPQDVAAAIEEHYRPTQSGGVLPATITGAVVAIADKIDSICGCFSVGLTPTGASDPYALRRQAVGIVQILIDKGFRISLSELIQKSLATFPNADPKRQQATGRAVHRFLKDRMAHLLAEAGYAKDVIAAVISVGADDIPDLWRRVEALQDLKSHVDFDPLAMTFKRVVNIIRRSPAEDLPGSTRNVDSALFQHPSETSLLNRYQEVRQRFDRCLGAGDYREAMREAAALKEPVDTFFDGVMVMAEDTVLRRNRLALLNKISNLFDAIADFSQLST